MEARPSLQTTAACDAVRNPHERLLMLYLWSDKNLLRLNMCLLVSDLLMHCTLYIVMLYSFSKNWVIYEHLCHLYDNCLCSYFIPTLSHISFMRDNTGLSKIFCCIFVILIRNLKMVCVLEKFGYLLCRSERSKIYITKP